MCHISASFLHLPFNTIASALFRNHTRGRLARTQRGPTLRGHVAVLRAASSVGWGLLSPTRGIMWIRTMLRCGVPKPLVLMVLLLALSGGLHCGEAGLP